VGFKGSYVNAFGHEWSVFAGKFRSLRAILPDFMSTICVTQVTDKFFG